MYQDSYDVFMQSEPYLRKLIRQDTQYKISPHHLYNVDYQDPESQFNFQPTSKVDTNLSKSEKIRLRNKKHAKQSRERKKKQYCTMKINIQKLQKENKQLKSIIKQLKNKKMKCYRCGEHSFTQQSVGLLNQNMQKKQKYTQKQIFQNPLDQQDIYPNEPQLQFQKFQYKKPSHSKKYNKFFIIIGIILLIIGIFGMHNLPSRELDKFAIHKNLVDNVIQQFENQNEQTITLQVGKNINSQIQPGGTWHMNQNTQLGEQQQQQIQRFQQRKQDLPLKKTFEQINIRKQMNQRQKLHYLIQRKNQEWQIKHIEANLQKKMKITIDKMLFNLVEKSQVLNFVKYI